MNRCVLLRMAFASVWLLTCRVDAVRAQSPSSDVDPQQARRAIQRGLDFLQADAVKWRADRTCSTCHHGTMTVWALCEAQSRGYAVAPEKLADMVQWTKGRLLERIDLPRDQRPGWSMVNTSAMCLSMMAQCVPQQDAITADELKRIAAHLLRHQEADGSWAWSSAPPKNRPPPFFESDEVATLLAYTALAPHVPVDANEKSDVRDARERAVDWLAKSSPTDTTQAAALRLFVKARNGTPAEALNADIEKYVGRQNKDGGWGQLKDRDSDAYATGQSLYLLRVIGLSADRSELQRAIAFLIATQKEDGSWPMVPRAHPEATPSGNPVPITYFGSAWGTLGLMRSVPAE